MPLTFNLRQLESDDVNLKGEISPAALDLSVSDELVHVRKNLAYNLTISRVDEDVLVRGCLSVVLDCECARCLKPFQYKVLLQDWMLDLPLEGEEKIVPTNDSVDLTPYVREDILLEFPQHALCEEDCAGLANGSGSRGSKKQRGPMPVDNPSVWSELNKLKF